MPRLRAATLIVLFLAGLAASPASRESQLPIDFYKAPSLGTAGGSAEAANGFSMPPMSDWRWYEGEPGCSLSPVGQNVDQVVRATMAKEGPASRLSSERHVTTTRNAFGPTLMDGKAIFQAAGRLMEVADHEVDFMSFAMEPDSDGYREVIRGFERRLQSGRPFPQPFRLRLYADHISVLFTGGRARPKARSLLGPWVDLYTKHKLDPRAFQIEVYVHAHGGTFYHRGGRYSVHDKLLIVDGSYVHIGGANPQKRNNFDHPERDTAVVVKGDIATSAMDAFDSLWSQSDFACTIEERGGEYQPACADRKTPFVPERSAAIRTPLFDRIGVSTRACLPMVVMSKGKKGFSNFDGYSNPWAKGLLAAVSASRRSIVLTSPNMNTPPLQAALVEAMTKRDVRVALLLPDERNESQVNSVGGFGSNRRSLWVMKMCAVRARGRSEVEFERFTRNFRIAWWVAEGATRRFVGDGTGCYHVKLANVDDQILIVGSGNLDDQSFYHSTETSILVDSAVVTRAVTGFIFEPEWVRAEPFDIWSRTLRDPWLLPGQSLEVLDPDAFGVCSALRYSLR